MSIEINNINSAHSTAYALFKWLCVKYPKQTVFILIGQLMSSISENISLVMLMPIIYYATGNVNEESIGIIKPLIDLANKFGINGSLALYLVLFIVAILFKALFSCFSLYYTARVGISIVAESRMELVQDTVNSDWSYISKLKSGVLTNIITNEANKFESSLSSCFNWVVSFISIIIYLATSFFISPIITLFSLLTGVLIFFIFKPLSGITYKRSIKNTGNVNSLSSLLSQTAYGLKALKAMSMESRSFQLIKVENNKIIHNQEKISLANIVLRTCQEPIVLMILATVMYFALTQFNLEVAVLAVIALIFIRIANKIAAYQKAVQSIGNNAGSIRILFETISAAKNSKEKSGKNKSKLITIDEVTLESISLKIGDKKLLDNLSLKFEKNTFSVITGRSGIGKTTMIDMILGFIKADEGKVLVNNKPIELIDNRSLRSNIGYIPQDVFLFNDTLINNITFGDNAFENSDLDKILEETDFYDYFKKEFLQINENIVENGKNLSGGQKQKIALARALIRKPKLLILDEATSALDDSSTIDIYKILKKVSENIIVIAISHDKKIYDYADHVYELNAETRNIKKVA